MRTIPWCSLARKPEQEAAIRVSSVDRVPLQSLYLNTYASKGKKFKSFRMGLRAFPTPTVRRDICIFAVLFSVSRPFFASHVFMMCY